FGRLHALDLANGVERKGWPVRVFTDFRKELVWGALTLASGGVYVPTASYCDSPSIGGVPRGGGRTPQVGTSSSGPAEGGGGRRRRGRGLGRRRLQPVRRCAVRGDGQRVSRRLELGRRLLGVRGLRRAPRRARAGPDRRGGESSEQHHGRRRPRLRRLTGRL